MMEIDPGSRTFPAECVRWWKVYRTAHEMVRDRGYLVSDLEMARLERCDYFADNKWKDTEPDWSNLTFLVHKPDDAADQVLVFFPEDESLGVKPIKKVCERMATQQITTAILVYRKTITPSAHKAIAQLAGKFRLETFGMPELLVNITRHELVPEHQLLGADDKRVLLQRYRLRDSQLPRIQPSDPVARYYGMRRGQVVKIIRKSETAGRYVTYRLCW